MDSVCSRPPLTLSEDDEDEQDYMPKIVNTISLQGCVDVSFKEESEAEGLDSVVFPKCEIKEEKIIDDKSRTEPIQNGLPGSSKEKESRSESKNEKKKIKLTHLAPVKHIKEGRPKPSTSRNNDHNVVDAKRLALQESLFKTKELFDTFLRVCQDQENSEQMERVVEKLSRAYSQTKQEYLGSLMFQNILESETEKVNTSNTKPWINLKLVLDELKHNKKTLNKKLKLGESEEENQDGGSDEDEQVIECPKKRRHLKKLEKVLRAVNLKIKKLEEKEVDWDDEDNSAYCKLDRYRAQFTKIYAKICEIKGKLPDADRPYLRKVSFAGTTYPHINRCIERYYNKHREFPDFQDIKKLVELANKQEGIEMLPNKIHTQAEAAFKEFGEMLKRLRQYDDYDILVSYLDQQVDPARDDPELQEQLNRNALLFKKKEQEVIDKFAAGQENGMFSESGDDSDSKPKKKKRKITVSNPTIRSKPQLSNKNHLSSSEATDAEEDKDDNKHAVRPGVCLSSSGDSESDNDSDAAERKPFIKGKGKSLIGRERLIKRGVKRNVPSNTQKPKTTISSSDEENGKEHTKESLTNYLGLQGKVPPKMTETNVLNQNAESDDEISCVKEVIRSQSEKKQSVILSGDSDSDLSVTSKSVNHTSSEVKSKILNKSTNQRLSNKNQTKNIYSSDSDIEPIAIVERKSSSNKLKHKIQCDSSHKSSIKNNSPLLLSASENDSDHRTNDNGSEKSEVGKNVSEVGLSNKGNNNLSSDSSDNVGDSKKNSDLDDSIVILSEDVIEESAPTGKKGQSKQKSDGSDSDDVCILTQFQTERRMVAPRKIKPNSRNPVKTPTNNLPRKPIVATSTPNSSPDVKHKRRLSNDSNNVAKKRTGRVYSAFSENIKQMTLHQVINGAARKTSKTVVCNDNSPECIPLIELD